MDETAVIQSDEMPIFNIVGTLIALGPSRRSLIHHFHRWLNSFAMQETLGDIPRPLTLEQVKERHEAVAKGENDTVFDIYECSTKRLIGATLLRGVNYRNRTAELIMFIGEPEDRGKGYGSETATRKVHLEEEWVSISQRVAWLLKSIQNDVLVA
jgi:RimJ/RimL family protein N-acetyltransferase